MCGCACSKSFVSRGGKAITGRWHSDTSGAVPEKKDSVPRCRQFQCVAEEKNGNGEKLQTSKWGERKKEKKKKERASH